jgi:hypothetical protein
MNTPIQTTSPAVPDRTADRQPRPVLREAMQRIATIAVDDSTAIISDTSMTFQNMGERTTISAEPMNVDTIDGLRIAEVITIRTPLTAFKLFDEKHYSFINIFATTGAVVRDADGEDLLISRLPVFEGDEEALANFYTPLIADAARLQPVGPLCGFYHFDGRREEYDAAIVGVPGWDEPSYWDSGEFAYAKERLRAQGAYANASDTGVTVEFPWEQGAVSAMAGDCTSLLQICSDQPHPSAGNGLFYRLDLPTNFSDDEAQESAARLNRAELEAVDAPPLFGAWCTMPKSGTVSFAGFWPNLLYKSGAAASIAFWTWARSGFARQVLHNLP